ncbi:MAG: hypothetical protein GX592_00975 [Clostridiales bacterium]|nr:hypothetical protein [Clostridiales bacterium]
MFLALSAPEISQLRAFLDTDEDCEALSENEYVADLYALDAPVSLNLVFAGGGAEIDGASYLAFDEALDGYYMSEPISSPEEIRLALLAAGALRLRE